MRVANTTRRTYQGAGNEKRACHTCQAQVYFARDGSEEICREWSTGRPHQCPDRQQKPKAPTSIHRDAKPEKGAATVEKLLTFNAAERTLMVRPAGGGSLEIRETASGYTIIGKSPGGTGIPLTPQEFAVMLTTLIARRFGTDYIELGANTAEVSE
jgi:hypothetical protein